MKPLDAVVERGADHGVVERVVDLGERVGKLVEVRDAADDRGEVDDVRAAADRLARLGEVAQVAAVDLAALAHPLRGLALVGDADLERGIAEQAAHDGRADRAGAAGDEDAVHAGVERTRTRTTPSSRPLRASSSHGLTPTSARNLALRERRHLRRRQLVLELDGLAGLVGNADVAGGLRVDAHAGDVEVDLLPAGLDALLGARLVADAQAGRDRLAGQIRLQHAEVRAVEQQRAALAGDGQGRVGGAAGDRLRRVLRDRDRAAGLDAAAAPVAAAVLGRLTLVVRRRLGRGLGDAARVLLRRFVRVAGEGDEQRGSDGGADQRGPRSRAPGPACL